MTSVWCIWPAGCKFNLPWYRNPFPVHEVFKKTNCFHVSTYWIRSRKHIYCRKNPFSMNWRFWSHRFFFKWMKRQGSMFASSALLPDYHFWRNLSRRNEEPCCVFNEQIKKSILYYFVLVDFNFWFLFTFMWF